MLTCAVLEQKRAHCRKHAADFVLEDNDRRQRQVQEKPPHDYGQHVEVEHLRERH